MKAKLSRLDNRNQDYCDKIETIIRLQDELNDISRVARDKLKLEIQAKDQKIRDLERQIQVIQQGGN